jgi:hypothetical protein
MNRRNSSLVALLAFALCLSACSGIKKQPCTTNCGGGGGNATVSITLVADTLPANPSILSFKVSVIAITLTPTTGTALNLQPPSPIVIDLMRLQSDTAFLGALTNVPSGAYTVEVTLSSPEIVFFNDTASTITAGGTACASGLVCSVTLTGVGNPTVSNFTFNATSSGQQGIEIDFNLKNAISLVGGALTVNFNPVAPVFTAFTLPRTNSNLATGQLELIEDFTGVVTVSGTTVTITSPKRGVLVATSTSNSFFDLSPDGNLCKAPASLTCVASGQIASIDAFLNSDGTLTLKEFEPLIATPKDFVEGTVVSTNSLTQFDIAVTDILGTATTSLIGGLNTGDFLRVNIPAAGTFLVDTKGLAVPPASSGLFLGQTDTTAIHPGQKIAIHVSAFVAATPTAFAIATADTVTLRWSRLIGTATGATSPSLINVTAIPSYFGFTQASVFPTQVFSGTLGADGVTNLDGISGGTAANVTVGQPIGLRALFLDNAQNNAPTPFMAAKIRQH